MFHLDSFVSGGRVSLQGLRGGSMKKTGFVMLVISLLAVGQERQQRPAVQSTSLAVAAQPTLNDLYCSGFITTEKVPDTRYVVGGLGSPEQSQYAHPTDNIYIHGQGIKEGDRFEFVRHVKDPNHYRAFPGQKAAIRAAGEPYFELGYARVVRVLKDIAIAEPELSCASVLPGDLAIPLVERTAPVFRKVTLDRYAPASGKTVGRIVMANEFDAFLGSKQKAYLNIGADKGLHPGDYLRATRTYAYSHLDPSESLSIKAGPYDDTQKSPHKTNGLAELPRLTLGDMIVLQVHPRSATVMILTALQTIDVGDAVELMDASEFQPLPAATAPPTIDTGVASPPTISCVARPAFVHLDEASTITCDAASPDNRPLTITFTSSAGRLAANKNVAILDTSTSGPGQVTVRATAFDDRQLSASTAVTVTVQPAAPAVAAQKMSDLDFKPNSSYVDNRSKAVLDDVALKLRQDPGSTVVLRGSSAAPEQSTLATKRAQNAMTYLTKSKGIDSGRIQLRVGPDPGHKVEVWTVPAGASPPPQ